MTNRELNRRIYLIGSRMSGYLVVTGCIDGIQPRIEVTSSAVGNAIVRALRELAREKPHLMPFSR